MRTTIDIPDGMYRKLKARAAANGKSAKALILQGVEQVLKSELPQARQKLKLPLVPSKRPGTMHLDNARIYELISFP